MVAGHFSFRTFVATRRTKDSGDRGAPGEADCAPVPAMWNWGMIGGLARRFTPPCQAIRERRIESLVGGKLQQATG